MRMSSEEKFKRLQVLEQVPSYAAIDHRMFLNSDGKDSRIEALPRHVRRRIEAQGKKIAAAYRSILKNLLASGVGYPVDKILRQFAIEYTHRYASSGVYTQPTSFNYFEAFYDIKFINESFAPYTRLVSEVDHLFSVIDYLDYATSTFGSNFDLSQLLKLPEGKVFHYTTCGSIYDFTFLTAEGREFVISGFSIIRSGNSLHWYMLGGEIFSNAEWGRLSADQKQIDLEHVDLRKRAFLEASMKDVGNLTGAPVALEGTSTAMRTIIAGETNLLSKKHVGRCYMSETENSFAVFCDDPDVLSLIRSPSERSEMLHAMQTHVERAGVMWNLAETMFQLPLYFDYKVQFVKTEAIANGQKVPVKIHKGGRGVDTHYRYISAIELTDSTSATVRPYTGPHYHVETEGHWRRLAPEATGRDADGNPVTGKTWIKARHEWRQDSNKQRTIYVKSSIAAAKIKLEEYLAKVHEIQKKASEQVKGNLDAVGVLYVLRCTVMKDGIYKVGWTSGTAEQRAKELSSATGVPSSFVVVDSWKHPDPEGLEEGVHALLTPYRISENREFFQANFSVIKQVIEAEVNRTTRQMQSNP